MKKKNILVVDDEDDILQLVSYNLKREGYDVECTDTGEKALKKVKQEKFDLIILDLMLPGVDGLEITKELKSDSQTKSIPIIILSAKGDEADIVTGIELGADDYITKPFSPRIMIARIKAMFRRQPSHLTAPSDVIRIRELVIHMGRREVSAKGQPIDLTYSEFQILALLARKPGWVQTRTQIIDAVRGDDYPVTDRSVDVQIVGLRKKLGLFGNYIETVRGVGYRFKETE